MQKSFRKYKNIIEIDCADVHDFEEIQQKKLRYELRIYDEETGETIVKFDDYDPNVVISSFATYERKQQTIKDHYIAF